MNILELVQGSDAWHAARAQHFCASEAPAMIGVSPYSTRNELLRVKKTGLAKEVDAATQARFNAGHADEAQRRAHAEEIVGGELYPVVATAMARGLPLLASFDGITLDDSTIWENKLGNAETIKHIELFGEPPEHHVWQLEHQLLVSGARRALFTCGDAHCWYESQIERRRALVAGWKQFAADLEAYVPTTPAVVAVAAPVESLPAVAVRVNGELAIDSNLPAFGTALRAFIDKIPAQPSTDQEFADTEAACKSLKKAEDALDSAETGALAQLASVEEMRRLVADLRNLARTTRLQREKMVAARKEQIRYEILQDAQTALAQHVAGLNQRIGAYYVTGVQADFANAMKGKKTVASLRDAADNALANAKVIANDLCMRVERNLVTIRQDASVGHLFPDVAALVLKASDDLAAVISHRIAEHEKAIEAARLKAEAEKKAADERADFIEVLRPKTLVGPVFNAARVQPAAPAVDTPPTLTLGQIGARLGFSLTAEFMRSIGFAPAGRQRAAVLYHEDDWTDICAALITHIGSRIQQTETV